MIDKTSHPFIVNTLESDKEWDLVLFPLRKPSEGWRACLVFDCTELDNWGDSIDGLGETAAEALDRLEDALSGRGSTLAGREYAKPDPGREDYLARWKDAPKWAQWLTQDVDGKCAWWQTKPWRVETARGDLWMCDIGPRNKFAKGRNLLGSVRCEPRPEL